MTEQELQAIEARERKATRGPWLYAAHDIRAEVMIHGQSLKHAVIDADAKDREVWDRIGHAVCGLACTRGKSEPEEANGRFIAAARQDVPALLAEVRRLQGLIKAAERSATVNRYEDDGCAFCLRGDREGLHYGDCPAFSAPGVLR